MADFFQSDAYYAFLKSTGFLEPFRFVVCRDGREVGRLQGYIQKDGGPLKRFLSRRAIINGGPWFAEDVLPEEVMSLLQRCSAGLRKRAIYIETRNFNDYSSWQPVFGKAGFEYEQHYDFIIDTASEELVELNMGKSRKRDVKTSLKAGAEIVDEPTVKDIEYFYNVLSDLYKSKVKTPLFPLAFFTELHKAGFAKFILVKYDNQIIGGTVLVFDDNTVYEWFACGRDGEFKNIYPSTLATYSAIRFASDSGHNHFDMMGAGAPGDGGYGVREFKAKFGGQLVEYGRFTHICNWFLYTVGKTAVKLMKRYK